MNKEILRKIYLQKRKKLSNSQVNQLSQQIFQNLFSRYSDFFESTNQLNNQSTNRIGKIIHTFLPIKKNNEVNTNILVNAIWSNDKYNNKYNDIKIVVPKVICIDGSKQLEHYYYTQDTVFVKSKWGIMEPIEGQPKLLETEIKNIDMIIVPLLCWNQEGNRIGYGGGFYDRFLKQCRSDTLKIGVSLFPSEKEKWKVDKWDIKLDDVISIFSL
tara:strand:+ start:100 stop:741 length:642 start_codon:yes stop_codon:yes gene_type:complete